MFTPKKRTVKPGDAFEISGNHKVHKERQLAYKRSSLLSCRFSMSVIRDKSRK
jgi:hypothetical protein